MSLLSLLPENVAADAALLSRLHDELGTTREGRAFFPTLRVREVCYRLRAESEAADALPGALYEAAAIVMLDLLLQREDLRLSWRPLEIVRVVAGLVTGTPQPQRTLLLLFLMVGLTPAEMGDVTGIKNVEEPLGRVRFLLGERLEKAGYSLERLYGGGIGPIGDVTRALEKVRNGEIALVEAMAADYQELLRIAESKLGLRRTPGYDSASDLISTATIRLPVNPEKAPQNRKELRALVSRIVFHVVIDHNVRPPSAVAMHEEADGNLAASPEIDTEDAAIRAQILDAVTTALERIRREQGTAIVPATRSLQDRLFHALMTFRIDQPRAFDVLFLKLEGNLTNKEIAARTASSVAGVKRDFADAVALFKAVLDVEPARSMRPA